MLSCLLPVYGTPYMHTSHDIPGAILYSSSSNSSTTAVVQQPQHTNRLLCTVTAVSKYRPYVPGIQQAVIQQAVIQAWNHCRLIITGSTRSLNARVIVCTRIVSCLPVYQHHQSSASKENSRQQYVLHTSSSASILYVQNPACTPVLLYTT